MLPFNKPLPFVFVSACFDSGQQSASTCKLVYLLQTSKSVCFFSFKSLKVENMTNEKYLSAEPSLPVILNGKSAQQNLQLGCEIVPWLKNWSLVENTETHFVFYQ